MNDCRIAPQYHGLYQRNLAKARNCTRRFLDAGIDAGAIRQTMLEIMRTLIADCPADDYEDEFVSSLATQIVEEAISLEQPPVLHRT